MAFLLQRCRSCIHAPRLAIHHGQRRFISDRLLQNQIAAEWEWKQQAEEIRQGKRRTMLQILEERGYVNQIAGSV
jgi:hypothetical protein